MKRKKILKLEAIPEPIHKLPPLGPIVVWSCSPTSSPNQSTAKTDYKQEEDDLKLPWRARGGGAARPPASAAAAATARVPAVREAQVGLDVGSERRGVTGEVETNAGVRSGVARLRGGEAGRRRRGRRGGRASASASRAAAAASAAALASRGGFANRDVGIDRNFADMGNPVAVGCDIQWQW